MDTFIQTKDNFITKDLCDDIILNFNKNNINHLNNLNNLNNPNNKQNINEDNGYEKYLIENNNIVKCVLNGFDEILKIYNKEILDYKVNIFLIDNEMYYIKLNKNKDNKKLNNYFNIKNNNNEYSFLMFIIFLNENDINSGIRINNNYIKPEIGKLLLFPCGWCFPYEYLMPSKQDNYFISGIIYNKFNT